MMLQYNRVAQPPVFFFPGVSKASRKATCQETESCSAGCEKIQRWSRGWASWTAGGMVRARRRPSCGVCCKRNGLQDDILAGLVVSNIFYFHPENWGR